jgi:hypothetical protein
VLNYSKGELKGTQIGVVANIAKEVTGPQISAVLNTAHTIKSTQVSLATNLAVNIEGSQIGLINFAKNVDGAQVGLISINDSISGASFGLINYSNSGPFHLNSYSDELGIQYFSLVSGSKYLFTRYTYGEKLFSSSKSTVIGLGLGTQLDLQKAKLFVEFDQLFVSSEKHQWNIQNKQTDPSLISRLRLSYARQILPWLSVDAGASLNYSYAMQRNGDALPEYTSLVENLGNDGAAQQHMWPGFSIGLRLGRI